ncbi:MAG: pantetheine-phosphate adenylyltransferase [bacterium]|nr:pantetheine-phosphate adenylyltransferase [bacterium]
MTVALCPGSFDPPTSGHVDVIRRCARLFDRVVVGVVANPSKQSFFTLEERVGFLQNALCDLPQVVVRHYQGLLVDFARQEGAAVLIKGLRAVSDFDSELQMAQMNQTVGGIETMFMPTRPEWSFLSSSLIREVAALGGSVQGLVPDDVAQAMKERFS